MAFPRFIYASFLPVLSGSLEMDFLNCIDQLARNCGQDLKTMKLTVFLSSENEEAFAQEKLSLKNIIQDRFPECPAFSVVSQDPAWPYRVCMEAVLVIYENVVFKDFQHFPYVVVETDDYKMLWAGGLTAENLVSVDAGAKFSFGTMQGMLQQEQMDFNDIVRQWNYIPQICYVEQENELLIQHYQSFNEVRHSFYKQHRSGKCFPAATGIGQRFGNFTLDLIAFQGKRNVKDLKIESPSQRNPYNYGQEVLVGTAGQKKHAPEFERARMLVAGNEVRILVSGTASIEDEITTDKDDITRQTCSTIRNIELLVSSGNLQSQYPWLRFRTMSFANLRVYVKYRDDIPKVEEVIKQSFSNVPVVVVQAEICRCDLLVEIEAELYGVLS
jgi:hypothetical protein